MSRSNSGRSSKRDSVGSIVHRASTDLLHETDSKPNYRLYPSPQNNTPHKKERELKSVDSKLQDWTEVSAETQQKNSMDGNSRVVSPVSPEPPQSDSSDCLNESLFEQRKPWDEDPTPRPISQFSECDPTTAPQTELPTPPDMAEIHAPDTTEYTLPRTRFGSITSMSREEGTHSRSGSRTQNRESGAIPIMHPPPSRRTTAIRNQYSASGLRNSRDGTPDIPEGDYEPGARSSAESVFSQATVATSTSTLPPLQSNGPDFGDVYGLQPVVEDDPKSFDLVAPPQAEQDVGMYALEKRADQVFGADHLRAIFEDAKLLLKFTGFLNSHRPHRIPNLVHYLDALKALRAIKYANEVAESLEPQRPNSFTDRTLQPTINSELERRAESYFADLVREDLPAYVAHIWIQVVSVSVNRRVIGNLAPHLLDASEGLAEVFCLSDPERTDNPILFASEQFSRTTHYGLNHAIGRNSRFLQGPQTSRHAQRRMADACAAGNEITEVVVNYRRDGSPFMNMVMVAPLKDNNGTVKYWLGAQVDVSGLARNCTSLDGLAKLVDRQNNPEGAAEEDAATRKDGMQGLRGLCEMFNTAELDTVRKSGGRIYKEFVEDREMDSSASMRRVRLYEDDGTEAAEQQSEATAMPPAPTPTGRRPSPDLFGPRVESVYKHYLIVRPAPSLRILFTSPSLRVPGIMQSPFLNRIGGSGKMRRELEASFSEGRAVTAKVTWLNKADQEGSGEGRPRYIHCTPLMDSNKEIGAWIVILVEKEGGPGPESGRRFRPAPPVAANIGGKEWDGRRLRTPEPRLQSPMGDHNDGPTRGMHSIDSNDYQFSPGSQSNSRQGYHHAQSMHSMRRAAGSAAGRHTPASSRDLNEFSFNLDPMDELIMPQVPENQGRPTHTF